MILSQEEKKKIDASQIFQEYRVLGNVTNYIPFSLLKRGTETFVTTSIGNSFHIYDSKKLNLLFVSPQFTDEISCLCSFEDFTIISSKNTIVWLKRAKKIFEITPFVASIRLMIIFGEFLLCVSEENIIKMFFVRTGDAILEFSLPIESFTITCLMHPLTYLNKVLFGSQQGKLQLWNLKTNKLVHEFEGWNSEVLCCVQSPAIDVVGLGLQNGSIIVFNILYAIIIASFKQEYGPVTLLSFRTDSDPIMASTSGGRIMFWNLEKRKLITNFTNSHESQITGLMFFHNEPILMTSSSDNSLKMWIFDQLDNNPRLLRSRSGHSAPPIKVKFYDEEGKSILSCGMDRSLRLVSCIKDTQNVEFSQKAITQKTKKYNVPNESLKLESILDFAFSATRENDWDNIITCHIHCLETYTWNFVNKTLGKHVLTPPYIYQTKSKVVNVTATAVQVTTCGNFALVGYSNGQIDKYNMQSGIHRGMYGHPAHDGAVRSIGIDACNSVMVSGSFDGVLKLWNFNTTQLLNSHDIGVPISFMEFQRNTSILAVVTDDFNLTLFDMDTQRTVRVFSRHTNKITSVSFSSDGRWIISSSMDGSVCVWDIPVGRLLDCFLFSSPVTSLSFSHTGQFLSTSHIDKLGIHLWANKTLFSNTVPNYLPSHFQPSYIEENISEDPNEIMEKKENTNENTLILEEQTNFNQCEHIQTLTLSSKPLSFWKTLTNLDIIKERNKPKDAPVKDEDVPFFLKTSVGLVPQFVKDETKEELKKSITTQKNVSRLINFSSFVSPFQSSMISCNSENDYKPLWELLEVMSPSSIEIEIRSLTSEDLLQSFLTFIRNEMAKNRYFDLLESYLAVFLKIHVDSIVSNSRLINSLAEILNQQNACWNRIQKMIDYSLSIINHIKGL